MTPPPSSTPPAKDARKRRAHRKSRRGCGNCKLRRVKVPHLHPTPKPHHNSSHLTEKTNRPRQCDETKPRCEKCTAYGVTCSYGPASDAVLAVEVGFKVDLAAGASTPPRPLDRYLSPPLPCAGSFESPDAAYQLTPADVRLLERFQKRTVLTLGMPGRDVYERKTLPLALGVSLLLLSEWRCS